MPSPTAVTPRPRAALLRERSLRKAWLLVLAGLLIPALSLAGSRIGWSWRRADGGGQTVLIAAGVVVFVVRIALWLTGVHLTR